MNRAALLMLVLLGNSCGSSGPMPTSTKQPAQAPAPPPSAQLSVEPEPLEIEFDAKRLGSSLRVDIACVGRGVEEGLAFEQPEQWTIRAHADGEELKRLVNGPVRVARSPVGAAQGSKWDIKVVFSVVFEVAETTREVEVAVTAPEGAPMKRRVAI